MDESKISNYSKKDNIVEDNSTEKSSLEKKKDFKEYISIKEIIILAIGIIIIFGAFIIIPGLFKQEPKTIAQMHLDNYKNKATETSFVYNGFSFLKLPDTRTNRLFWYTQYKQGENVYDLPMRYNPLEVENITEQVIKPMPNRNFEWMYITIDPKNDSEIRQYLTLAVSELTEKFNTVKNYPMVGACTVNETLSCAQRPIVNCTNSEDHIVLYFKDEGESKIIIDGNCVTIQGEGEELMLATDKIIYKYLGIIK